MLILLPPSEGKNPPRRGLPLNLDGLSASELTPTRERILDTLIHVSAAPDGLAQLGLSPGQADQLEANVLLRTAPTARADKVYTGVLYEALGFDTLSPEAPSPGQPRGWPSPPRCSASSARRIGSRPTGWPARCQSPRSGPGRGRVARRLGPGRHRDGGSWAADRPPLLDVRRVLATDARRSRDGSRRFGCCTRPTASAASSATSTRPPRAESCAPC